MSPTRAPTARLLFVVLLLALAAGLWLALRAAAPGTLAPTPTAPVTYAPTVEPTAGTPVDTESAVTPEGFYATQQAGEQATSVARATAQPFPTAGPAAIQTGQPASASTSRGRLNLTVRLPKDTYLSGEAGWAEVTLRNDGPETVMLEGGGPDGPFGQTLLDAQGHFPPPWPWQPVSFPGGPPYLQAIAPGQSLTRTLTFQVVGPAPSYDLWVDVEFARVSLTNPLGPDPVGLRLEAGPVALRVLPPDTGRQLFAHLQADHQGWSLRVTDAAGHVPDGPLNGEMAAGSANSETSGPLPAGPGGVWSGSWNDMPNFATDQFTMRAWVGAPGYISAVAQQTVPGGGEASRWFTPYMLPPPRTFVTRAAAEAALGIPVYRLKAPVDQAAPADQAVFDALQAVVFADGDYRSITVQQAYHLPSGAYLELTQTDNNQPFESAGWGEARYDSEARPLTVAGQPAYLLARWGWWALDWKIGAEGFELRAPVGAISAAALVGLAGSVGR